MRKFMRWVIDFFSYNGWRGKPLPRKNTKASYKRFESGPLVYLDTLLDNLDDYHEAIKTLKRHHPDAYNYYSQIGGGVGSSKDAIYIHELPTRWKDRSKRPGMVMVHFPPDKDDGDKRFYPIFLYLCKHRYIPGVQFTNIDTYECTVFYRDNLKKAVRIAMPFYVSIDNDNEISLLLQQEPRRLTKGRARGEVIGRRWAVPIILKDLGKEKGKSPKEIAHNMIAIAAGLGDQVGMGLLVRAKRDGCCATFSIDMLRTPYFFKGRNKTVNHNGKTKPIFHIVRTHKRKTGSLVKTHFRGLRRFDWLGYDVTVSMPGLHHRLPTHMNLTAHDQNDPLLKQSKWIASDEVGRRIAAHLDG